MDITPSRTAQGVQPRVDATKAGIVSAREKALRLIGEGRVRLRREAATRSHLEFEVIGDTDRFEPYVVICELDGGRVRESCNCDYPKVACSHIQAVRLVLRAVASPLAK